MISKCLLNELETPKKTVTIFSQDKEVKFGIEKYARLMMNKR